MLDVTDCKAGVGDEVIVIGRSGELRQEIWDMADIYGSTVGEVLFGHYTQDSRILYEERGNRRKDGQIVRFLDNIT